eukprot:29739-Pelagococcus_subviridis.AAC.3
MLPSWLYAHDVTCTRPGRASCGLTTDFCAPRGSPHIETFQIRREPSADAVNAWSRSVGCHAPDVHGEQWPFVFFKSLMYMSPLSNSPSSRPSRS